MMLREITAAGDRERTGAIDVEWKGAHASLFFMFGHPSHIVFESPDGRTLVGNEALTKLVAELPTEFRVAPWRRAMVTEDTLRLSADDLMALFEADARGKSNGHANAAALDPPGQDGPGAIIFEHAVDAAPAAQEGGDADGLAPPPPPAASAGAGHPTFGVKDFPLLPLGPVLWSDAMANVVNLEAVVPRLPDCLLVLTGPDHQAAALVAGGAIADAVWVSGNSGLLGDDAAVALMTSREGHLAAHRIDDPRLVATLPVLWRGPRVAEGLSAGWLHSEDIVADVKASGRTCALLFDAGEKGVALFHEGVLVAAYTREHRRPATTMTALRSLLREPRARITVAGDLGAPPEPETAEQPASTTEDEATADAVAAAAAAAPEPPASEVVAESDASAATAESAATTDVHEVTEADATEAADDSATTAVSALDEPAAPEPVTEAGAASVEIGLEPAATEPRMAETSGDIEATAAEIESETAVFSIASLEPEAAAELDALAQVEAREAKEFVPPRLDIDVDALRTELTDIAVAWLSAGDAAPVAMAIAETRPGVDDFVSTIAAIGVMQIPGHEAAVVRAMAREMHYRASEVLCGV